MRIQIWLLTFHIPQLYLFQVVLNIFLQFHIQPLYSISFLF